MQYLSKELETILRRKSKIYKEHNSNWVEIFCPFCNDATRKASPDHGHLYYFVETGFFNCFRCSETGPITKLLSEYGIYDKQLFGKLSTICRSDITYSKIPGIANIRHNELDQLHTKLVNNYLKYNSSDFKIFYNYIISRCFDIDINKFLIYPNKDRGGYIGCAFNNASDQYITTRYINHPTQRYSNSRVKNLYYFQELRSIIDYSHIVICEGVFDAINLYSYYTEFQNAFCIAINGNHYVTAIKDIINKYLRIGVYTISIVFDSGLKKEGLLIKSLIDTVLNTNPNITLQLYKPKMSKDSSEFMLLYRLL